MRLFCCMDIRCYLDTKRRTIDVMSRMSSLHNSYVKVMHVHRYAGCLHCLWSIIECVSGDPVGDIIIGLTVLLSSIWTEWLRYAGCTVNSMKKASCLVCFWDTLSIMAHHRYSDDGGILRNSWHRFHLYLSGNVHATWVINMSALHHRRNAIASLRYVTPHPTMTEMLAINNFVIKSALYRRLLVPLPPILLSIQLEQFAS